MAIILKSPREIKLIRRASQVVAGALKRAGEEIRPGVTTADIDRVVAEYIIEQGCTVAFKGLYDYPANTCISVNEQVVHGIPGRRKLEKGDIVSIDVGAGCENYFGDSAVTFAVGEISPQDRRLMDVCRESLGAGIRAVGPGEPLMRVSAAVQKHVEAAGFSVVRKYVGHGIGLQFHEEPQIPNYVESGRGGGVILRPSMALAIEPMVNAGGCDVETLADEWTVVTADGSKSAHFEHTVVVSETGVEVLSQIKQ